MPNQVPAIPKGYRTLTPYLVCKDAARAIDFYKEAFDAEELYRINADDKIGHAEIRIGDSIIMICDEFPEMGNRSPESLGGTPVSLLLYVANADEVFEHAVAAGGKVQRPMRDQFYGDRSGSLQDPFGHIWHVSTHVEDVPEDELKRRAESAMAKN